MILPDDKNNELLLVNRAWIGPIYPDQTYYERTPYYTKSNKHVRMLVSGNGGLISHLVGYMIMGGDATLLDGLFYDD
jgi:hypothetical protein